MTDGRERNGAKDSERKKPVLALIEGRGKGRNPRALVRLEWIAVGLLAAALFFAPLLVASFATPSPQALVGDETWGGLRSVSLSLLTFLIVGALGLTLWRERQRPVAVGAVPGLAGSACLLGGWAVVSLWHTRGLALSLNTLVALLAGLLLAGLTSRLARDRTALIVLGLAMVTGAALVSAFGVREYLTLWKEGNWDHRTFATFVNPDFLAGYLLLTIPLTLAVFTAAMISAQDRLIRLLLGLTLLLQSACLLLTGSRAGVGILLAGLAAWLLLVLFSGAASGRGRPISTALVVFVIGALLASAPTLARFGSHTRTSTARTQASGGIDTQSHSGAFRRWTWIGTTRMARANPVFGAGIGTFDVAYPRYAVTAYTGHAHNGFLQWAGETGVPGAFLLITCLAAAAAFASRILLLRREADVFDEEDKGAKPWVMIGLLDDPRLLLSGLLAALLTSLLHNFIDSDWYIVATLFTLCGILGLMIALARDIAPLATQTPRPLGAAWYGIGVLLAVFLLWRGGSLAISRLQQTTGGQALNAGMPQPAQDAFRAAESADPFDPEPPLNLATLSTLAGQPDAAKEELNRAVQVSPSGRTYYRLAQFHARRHDTEAAQAAFEKAREYDPNNVQNLRALGDMLHEAGRIAPARAAYNDVAALETQPYGEVRAMPEVVETEFGHAYAGLGDLAYTAQNWSEAAKQYAEAARIFGEYWRRHKEIMSQLITPEKKRRLLTRYDEVLTRLQEALQKSGASATRIEAVKAQRDAFRHARDVEAEAEAANAAQDALPTAPGAMPP